MNSTVLLACIGFAAVSCGVERRSSTESSSHQHEVPNGENSLDVIVTTTVLTEEEIQARGYSLEYSELYMDELARFQNGAVAGAAAYLQGVALVNTLAGVAQVLMGDKSSIEARSLGNAVPAEADPLSLVGSVPVKVVLNKSVKSFLGATILNLDYKIEARTQAKFDGRGQFIIDLRFVPLSVQIDPMYSIKVAGLSSMPVNVGTEKNAISQLDAAISFYLSGFSGSKLITDEVTVRGDRSKIEVQSKDF